MSFLAAEWRKLALANYEVDPSVLTPYVPYGTELDLWSGKCFLSLVGFMFQNTRLMGIKIPFHINFEEVNLRFYVKRFEDGVWKRGVVFIKEIVPKPALAFVANTVYYENYETLPMRHSWSKSQTVREVKYAWKKAKVWNEFRISASLDSTRIEQSSETEFITEHYWGYARVSDDLTNEYEVTHPKWRVYTVLDYDINVNFEVTYGRAFSFLNKQAPASVMLAEGSEITVEGKKKIRKVK